MIQYCFYEGVINGRETNLVGKTVEYAFLKKFLDKYEPCFALPLDGNAEIAGDAIFGDDVVAKVVEFKRAKDCLSTEKWKFASQKIKDLGDIPAEEAKALAAKAYTKAKSSMEKDDANHFIVYADFPLDASPDKAANMDAAGTLQLFAQTYFSAQPKSISETLKKEGWKREALRSYLKKFVGFKLYGEVVDVKEGDSSASGKGHVIGISTATDEVFVIPLAAAVEMLLDMKYYAKIQKNSDLRSVSEVPTQAPLIENKADKAKKTISPWNK